MDEQSTNSLIDRRSIAEAISILFKSLAKLGSALLAYAVFAYLLGWLQAKSYYSIMGAEMIINELSLIAIVSFSWTPLILILFFLYLQLIDLYDREGSENKKIEKIENFILRNGALIFIILFSTYFSLKHWAKPIYYQIVVIVLVFWLALFVVLAFKTLVINLRKRDFNFGKFQMALIYTITVFGFYYIPTLIGEINANKDIDVKLSQLYKVELKIPKQQSDMRLLYNNADRYFLIDLKESSDSKPIYIVNYNQIESINKK